MWQYYDVKIVYCKVNSRSFQLAHYGSVPRKFEYTAASPLPPGENYNLVYRAARKTRLMSIGTYILSIDAITEKRLISFGTITVLLAVAVRT